MLLTSLYWINVVGFLHNACVVGLLIIAIVYAIVFIINLFKNVELKQKHINPWIIATFLVGAILIPSKTTIGEMAVQKALTPSNELPDFPYSSFSTIADSDSIVVIPDTFEVALD